MKNRSIDNLYVIYYGWLISDKIGTPGPAAMAIAAARPEMLIGFYYTFEPKYPNFSQQVCDLLHAAQIKLFAYINTDYGDRHLAPAKRKARDNWPKGVDGIFF